MPSPLRGAWLNGVAGMYAQSNPRAALDWIEQFRGSPEYDAAALAVIMPASRVDPEAAAHAAESLGRDDYRRTAVTQVAMGWAQRDPARAAAWASGLSDPAAQKCCGHHLGHVESAGPACGPSLDFEPAPRARS